LVVVAFVLVALTMSRFVIVEEAEFTRMPPVNERSVEVALFGNGQVKPPPVGQLVMQVSPDRQIVVAPKVVVVAFVPRKVEAKSVVEVALVDWSVVEKKLVEVACEVVAFLALKSWKVEEAETARLVRKPVAAEMAVEDAYGRMDAVVEVATM